MFVTEYRIDNGIQFTPTFATLVLEILKRILLVQNENEYTFNEK
jgi:hypothetical protein